MEEEIDLREYIAVLIKYWYWIVGVTILMAVAAFIATSFMTPKYEAEAKEYTDRIAALEKDTENLKQMLFNLDGIAEVMDDNFVAILKSLQAIVDNGIKLSEFTTEKYQYFKPRRIPQAPQVPQARPQTPKP